MFGPNEILYRLSKTVNVYHLDGRHTGLPWWLRGKESTCNAGDAGSFSWVRKIPWRRKWQPTPVFLPGEFHGQRSLAGYSPWSLKTVRHDLATKQQHRQ